MEIYLTQNIYYVSIFYSCKYLEGKMYSSKIADIKGKERESNSYKHIEPRFIFLVILNNGN